MAKFLIKGQKKLGGEINVLGSKNAAIKMIAASILIKDKVILENVPKILDIDKIIFILKKMGAKITRHNHKLEINTSRLRPINPDPDLVRTMRASIVLVGPLLARFGQVAIPHPGGCIIGARPIDLHIKAFEDLGIKVRPDKDFYYFSKSKNICNVVSFEKISVTASENILLFASFHPQTTTINNIAIEPEVIDLINFLKKAGAKINLKNRVLKCRGNNNLKSVKHQVIPDRIEAGTWAILAATTQSNLKINNLDPNHLKSLLDKFNLMGLLFEKGKDFLYIKKSPNLKAININTAEYPGFPTDLQSPMGVLLTQCQGISQIKENIFEHRLGYLKELQKMGAKINILNNREAIISGPCSLKGTQISSLDIRAGATLIIAGLIAQGQTEILEAENIDRGYEKIEKRLSAIGADIKRIS